MTPDLENCSCRVLLQRIRDTIGTIDSQVKCFFSPPGFYYYLKWCKPFFTSHFSLFFYSPYFFECLIKFHRIETVPTNEKLLQLSFNLYFSFLLSLFITFFFTSFSSSHCASWWPRLQCGRKEQITGWIIKRWKHLKKLTRGERWRNTIVRFSTTPQIVLKSNSTLEWRHGTPFTKRNYFAFSFIMIFVAVQLWLIQLY